MAASLKRLFGQDEVPSPEAANSVSTAASRLEGTREPEFSPILPPRRVQRTRTIVIVTALAALGWLGYLAYQQWLIYTDPIARAISGAASTQPAGEAVPPTPIQRAPEPPRAAPIQRAPEPARAAQAPRQAASPSPAPRVTHTLREEPKPAAPAAAPVPPAAPAAARAKAAAPARAALPCNEATAALGFCTPAEGGAAAKGESR